MILTTNTDYSRTKTPAQANMIQIIFRDDQFTTKCRALEQYLYAHKIKPAGWYKDENNFTVWYYPKTDALMELVNRYAAIQVFGTGWREQRNDRKM